MKCTVADFIVKYIDNQYIEIDGIENKFVEGVFTIFGHGNVLGLGQSLEFEEHNLNVIQGKNEQGMAHSAIGFAKQRNRKSIYAVTTSIGPGCTNLVTAAATATINKIPLLLLPGDTFENGQPDPVLQQLEQQSSAMITATSSLNPVSKYYERVTSGERIYSILERAFSVLTCPEQAGAVTIALPQDIQSQIIEVDEKLILKKVWKIKRRIPSKFEISELKSLILNHEKILFVCGGGVKYSEAGEELDEISQRLNIPIVETQAGKSAVVNSKYNLGGIGVTGTDCANQAVKDASLIISLGSRLNDFTSQSSSLFKEKELVSVNLNGFDGIKQGGTWIDADIKQTLCELISEIGEDSKYLKLDYFTEYAKSYNEKKIKLLSEFVENSSKLNQTSVVLKLNQILEKDAIIVAASGSLPADLERLWNVYSKNSYHMEYGNSCMGYEINGALGAKLAEMNRPVYVFVGDGSFNMLHSELLTSLQYAIPINVILLDNSGFGCINNLQCEYGSDGYRTEYRTLDKGTETNLMNVDYAKIAEGYGASSCRLTKYSDLDKICNQSITTLFELKVDPNSMTSSSSGWWDVGFNRISKTGEQDVKFKNLEKERRNRNEINIDK